MPRQEITTNSVGKKMGNDVGNKTLPSPSTHQYQKEIIENNTNYLS